MKFLPLYETRQLITAFTRTRHLPLHWPRWIHSVLRNPFLKDRFSHLRLGLPSGLLPSGFPTKILYEPFVSPYVLYALPILVFSIWSSQKYVLRSTDRKAPYCVVFSAPCYHVPVRPKYPLQHRILEDPQSMFLPQCERPSFTRNLVYW